MRKKHHLSTKSSREWCSSKPKEPTGWTWIQQI